MGIKEVLAKMAERKNKFKELEEDFQLRKKLEDRQKSANERDLERYLKEQREDEIKKSLESFRKKQADDFWASNQLSKNNMSKNQNNILKQKNIFKLNSGLKEEAKLFFK